ncbi:alanine racemase domain-containing protein [Cupriavidus basilensis OR16]|uniref:Alanine racemase domain-containing protein n=1 Tax=Cupriavidus basilensis OR16 TaxID=1127483 RepID=H1S1U8_9BURK|nr:alanine racemase [Cupriavidus basilensis]EHP43442.1 alanine racemase domain-containing protein [Cupriavidus basilensis OR16]
MEVRDPLQTSPSCASAQDNDNLAIPSFPIETPCFVILEAAVLHNLQKTAEAAGGIQRLMPHIKTHRAQWLVELLVRKGVKAFKAATPAEMQMAAAGGAQHLVWAYPTVNPAAISRVADVARRHPNVQFEALVDSQRGFAAWRDELGWQPASNVKLRLDLDPGLGRTGVPLNHEALELAHAMMVVGLFSGWHCYDGHIKGANRSERVKEIESLIEEVRCLLSQARREGLPVDLIAGGSYSFDVWPADVAQWVAPGSWTYSSAQHQADLPDFGWRVGAYVLATVLSTRQGTATLDAGTKAISPDIPLKERFQGPGPIRMMKEEHVVIETDELDIGQQAALVPRHTCTAAYLYNRALVQCVDGSWEFRDQLGAQR